MSNFEKKMGKASLAAITGIGTVGAGVGIAENQKKYEEDKKRLEEKNSSDKESGGGSESTARPKAMKKGGSVKSASARADGCAIRGKTRA
jgi:hypothetical protein